MSNKGNATQAYINAYGCENYGVAKVEACNLMKNELIQEEIVKLTEPNSEALKDERERIKDMLWSMVQDTEEKTENRIRAIDVLNKMDARYIQRTENTNETSVKLDNSTLETLLNGE